MPGCAGADLGWRLPARRARLGVPAGRSRRVLADRSAPARGRRRRTCATGAVARRRRRRSGAGRGGRPAADPAVAAGNGLSRPVLGRAGGRRQHRRHAAVAAALGRNAAAGMASGSATRESPPGAPARPGHGERVLRVARGGSPPEGWAGKVWAMEQGLRAAGDCEYVLFTDADIGYAPGTLTALVRAAEADGRALVSQMALLRADTGWERVIVPAFVYFFAQLYPFRRVNRPGSRTAAAAGGCMLVRREVLAAAGGLERIRDARIDDVALGRLLKRPPAQARCWLGFTSEVRSRRPYPRLADLWDMVARSAYTQLRYSPALLAATVAGLLWLYLVPPAGAIAGLIGLAAGGGAAAAWCAAAGLGGWALMAATYLPVLRLYRLSPLRAPGLPLIALLYAAMTVDSARRHRRGRGGGKSRALRKSVLYPHRRINRARRRSITGWLSLS